MSGESAGALDRHPGEFIPGMAEQGEGIKVYVESDYAPLKACLVGNPSAIHLPDPDTWEYANTLSKVPESQRAYLRQHAGKDLKESDPEMWEKMSIESDALAEAYRNNGVRVIRNETDETPMALIDYTLSWSGQRQMTLFGQSAFEVFGNCLVAMHEVSNSYAQELSHRQALVEIFKNDPDAVWLTMPPLYPSADHPQPGPFLSPGDPIIFDKLAVVGIGVSDPSHIDDPTKPRSSGDEFGAEILRRMLAPHGWEVEVVYFNTNFTYHIDALWAPLEEGLISMPEDCMFSPLPDQLKDWEILYSTREDHDRGCNNNEPLGDKRVVLPAGTTQYADDLAKRGWEPIEVPYENIYGTIGSGIHCSTGSIWREFD